MKLLLQKRSATIGRHARERGRIVQSNSGGRRGRFWLIAGRYGEGGEPEPLGVEVLGGGRALAVFSFKEEALAYLRLGAPQGRWRAREVGAEELASMLLLGPCSRFGWVALDPMPEISARAVVRLVSTSRERFLDFLKDLLMDKPENTHPLATWYLPDGTRSFLDGRRRSDGRRP